MNIKKWFVRVGALSVMAGFVLPSLTVSCTALPATDQSFSLVDLATIPDFFVITLFLIPLGALVTLVFAFIPASRKISPAALYFGQAAGAVAGVAGILIVLLWNLGTLRKHGFDVSPEYGVNVLAAGYALIALGLVYQLPDLERKQSLVQQKHPREKSPEEIQVTMRYNKPFTSTPDAVEFGDAASLGMAQKDTNYTGATPQGTDFSPHEAAYDAPPSIKSAGYPVAPTLPQAPVAAWLKVIHGDLPESTILLSSDKITVGRGTKNYLRLPARSVSRYHAQLRFAQGTWFIQDQGSAGGTFVNGQRINATRLRANDRIEIGEYLFELQL